MNRIGLGTQAKLEVRGRLAWTHADAGPITVTYAGKDFTHWDAPTLGSLNVDQIERTDLYAAVTKCYTAS